MLFRIDPNAHSIKKRWPKFFR